MNESEVEDIKYAGLTETCHDTFGFFLAIATVLLLARMDQVVYI